VVSISGCDPLDPGSNPGTAKLFFCWFDAVQNEKKVLPGLEPGLQGSEPWVLTNYTIEPVLRQWCIGNIEASQALAPGSTPGWRMFFCLTPQNTEQKMVSSLLAGLNRRPFAYKANALPLS
jgi:hypothetical protein